MLFRPRQQTVMLVAIVAMVGGFVLFRYLPLQKKMKELEHRRAAQMLVVTRALAEGEQIPVLENQLCQLQRAVGNYEQQVPDNRGLGEFLHKIANLMNKHNLKEQRIEPHKEIETDTLNCIQVNIQGKGGLGQIFEFYKSLQDLDRLVRVEHVRLVNDGDFSGEVDMKTEASIYYRPGKIKS